MMDVLELLRERGIEVRQNSSNENEYTICCLFCGDMGHGPDERFRLGFNIESGLAGCFNCGWKSRKALIEIARKLDVSGDELAEIRAIPTTRETRTRPEVVKLPKGFQRLDELDEDDPYFSLAISYVKMRGITKRQLREKEIGATLDEKDYRYRYRIIFPVQETGGKLVGFVGRDYIGDSYRKYMNMVGTKVAYNARPDLYPRRLAILSEGVTKSLAIERATRYKLCSAASLGNSLGDGKANVLTEFQEVALFPDPDKQGMRGYLGIAANLSSVVKKVTMAWPWPRKQADDLTPREIREALRNRQLYTAHLEFEIQLEMRMR